MKAIVSEQKRESSVKDCFDKCKLEFRIVLISTLVGISSH